jgi:hypothetical protein
MRVDGGQPHREPEFADLGVPEEQSWLSKN